MVIFTFTQDETDVRLQTKETERTKHNNQSHTIDATEQTRVPAGAPPAAPPAAAAAAAGAATGAAALAENNQTQQWDIIRTSITHIHTFTLSS
jgi:hypothetical protein